MVAQAIAVEESLLQTESFVSGREGSLSAPLLANEIDDSTGRFQSEFVAPGRGKASPTVRCGHCSKRRSRPRHQKTASAGTATRCKVGCGEIVEALPRQVTRRQSLRTKLLQTSPARPPRFHQPPAPIICCQDASGLSRDRAVASDRHGRGNNKLEGEWLRGRRNNNQLVGRPRNRHMADGQESRTASRKVRGGLAFWSLLLPESGEGDEVRLESFHRSKWKRTQEPKGPVSENKGEVETNVERKGGHRRR